MEHVVLMTLQETTSVLKENVRYIVAKSVSGM